MGTSRSLRSFRPTLRSSSCRLIDRCGKVLLGGLINEYYGEAVAA
jgi:hypothetical protein